MNTVAGLHPGPTVRPDFFIDAIIQRLVGCLSWHTVEMLLTHTRREFEEFIGDSTDNDKNHVS